MTQRKVLLTNEQRSFAQKLLELYPGFLSTKSLYLDFEGSGGGHESVISLYWPQNSGTKRFACIMRSEEGALTSDLILKAIERLGLARHEVNQVVVYSGGQQFPDERQRLIDLLDEDPWPTATWVNLLWVTQKSKEMASAIKEHRNVVYKKDKTQVRRSLEALEWEFGIFREPSIRSHSNVYSDGRLGEMEILKLIKKILTGLASATERAAYEKYCLQDVKSMFTISRLSERGIFTPKERGARLS